MTKFSVRVAALTIIILSLFWSSAQASKVIHLVGTACYLDQNIGFNRLPTGRVSVIYPDGHEEHYDFEDGAYAVEVTVPDSGAAEVYYHSRWSASARFKILFNEAGDIVAQPIYGNLSRFLRRTDGRYYVDLDSLYGEDDRGRLWVCDKAQANSPIIGPTERFSGETAYERIVWTADEAEYGAFLQRQWIWSDPMARGVGLKRQWVQPDGTGFESFFSSGYETTDVEGATFNVYYHVGDHWTIRAEMAYPASFAANLQPGTHQLIYSLVSTGGEESNKIIDYLDYDPTTY